MTVRKKYIHLLFLVGLFLHSLPVMSSEFMYGTDTEEVVEVGRDISTIIKDNPAYVMVPAAALLGGCLFYAQKKFNVYQTCCLTCMNLQNQLNNKCVKMQSFCADCSSGCVDMIFPRILRTPARAVLDYIFKGFNNYVANNKKIIAGALLLHVVGRTVLSDNACNAAVPTALTIGFLKSMWDKLDTIETKLDNGFSDAKEEVKRQFTDANEEQKRRFEQASKEQKESFANLDKEIASQFAAAEGEQKSQFHKLNKKVDDGFGDINAGLNEVKSGHHQLITQSEKNRQELAENIGDLGARIDSMKNQLSKDLGKRDAKNNEQFLQLGNALKELTGQYLKSENQSNELHESILDLNKKFSSLEQLIVNETKKLHETSQNELRAIRTEMNQFGAEVTKLNEKMDQLLQRETDYSAFLEKVQQLKSDFSQLFIEVNAMKQVSEQLVKQQEKSAEQLIKIISEIGELRKNIPNQVNKVYEELTNLKERVSALENNQKKQHEETMFLFKSNNQLVLEEQQSTRQRIGLLEQRTATLLEQNKVLIEQNTKLMILVANANEKNENLENLVRQNTEKVEHLGKDFVNTGINFDHKLKQIFQEIQKVTQNSLPTLKGQDSKQLGTTKEKKIHERLYLDRSGETKGFNSGNFLSADFTQLALEAEQKLDE